MTPIPAFHPPVPGDRLGHGDAALPVEEVLGWQPFAADGLWRVVTLAGRIALCRQVSGVWTAVPRTALSTAQRQRLDGVPAADAADRPAWEMERPDPQKERRIVRTTFALRAAFKEHALGLPPGEARAALLGLVATTLHDLGMTPEEFSAKLATVCAPPEDD